MILLHTHGETLSSLSQMLIDVTGMATWHPDCLPAYLSRAEKLSPSKYLENKLIRELYVVLSIQEAVEREWTHSKTLCSSVSSCLCYVGVSLKLKKIMKVSQRICHLLCAGREQSCASTIFVLD